MITAEKDCFITTSRAKNVDIVFENISYSAPNGRKGNKTIIDNVSGKFKSGELTAIMGPSGAGKTTLLNILTGFRKKKGMRGLVKAVSEGATLMGAHSYKKLSCYILQDDHLNPFFTVWETMHIAADLKLGGVSKKEKEFMIDDVLDALGLSSTKDTRCCSLSGGQKKRLSIALELIDNPPIMFLDEPTTGLDSLSSSQCINMLKGLARGGRTIICTIHQPSASIFEIFDHVYVVAEGKCIYQGASLNTVLYLAATGLVCPQYHNPADFLLEVANGEYGNFTDHLAKISSETQWRKYQVITKDDNNKNDNVIEKYSDIKYNRNIVEINPPCEWYKFYILLKRAFVNMYRDWTMSHLKVVLHFMVGIVLGLMYWKTGNDGSKTITNVGFLICSTVYLAYTSLLPAILRFPAELAVLKKERFNNWYNLKTYYIAFLVSDIPMQILFSVTYISTSYFMSDQPSEPWRFCMVLSILIMASLTASSMGLVIGSLVNPVNGTFFGAIFTALLLAVAGFLIFFNHMPIFMYGVAYLSYIAYAYEGLVNALYSFDRAPLPCPDEVEYCHFKFPKDLLQELGMTKNNYWSDLTFLVCNVVVFRALAYWALKTRLKQN